LFCGLVVVVGAGRRGVARTRLIEHFPDAVELDALRKINGVNQSTTPFLVTLIASGGRNLSVTWSTMNLTCSEIEFGTIPTRLHLRRVGASTSYSLAKGQYRSQQIHVVHFDFNSTELRHASLFYRVGCAADAAWSAVMRVVPAPSANDAFTVFAAADVGNSMGGQAVLRHMRQRAHALRSTRVPALVLVAGDVAYGNGDLSAPPFNGWDRFQALLSPIASSVPVAVCEGNHDGEWDEHFVPLRARFAPPARWYTIDRGAVRFIVLSTEDNNDVELEEKQMLFLRRALKAARSPSSGVEWLIVVGHRPLFDSNRLYGDQTELRAQMIPLFDEFAVDLYIGGHQHDYERTYPLVNRTGVPVQLVPSSAGKPYAKGNGTIYTVIACERRRLRNILLGFSDELGNAAGGEERLAVKDRKLARKEARRAGRPGESVAEIQAFAATDDQRAEAAVLKAQAAIRDAYAGKPELADIHTHSDWKWPSPQWSAVRSADAYGYTELTFGANGSSLHWRFWRMDDNGEHETLDEFFVCRAGERCRFSREERNATTTQPVASTTKVSPSSSQLQTNGDTRTIITVLHSCVGLLCVAIGAMALMKGKR
jgi:hypothetical protein